MFYFLFQCVRVFGFWPGLWIHLNIKIFKRGTITLQHPKQKFFFRANTVDVHTFREIFLREEYNITLPEGVSVATIIDAGANIGFTSVYLSQKFPGAKIFSLEPDAENFSILVKNTEHNSNITPIQKALWNKSGFIKISDQGYGVRGFIVEDVEAGTPGTVLPSVSLTDLIDQYNITSIDILKMDIEGSEKELFERDTTWLRITKCLVIELHDRMKPGCSKSVFHAITQYNFDCTIKGENLVFMNRDLM